MLVNKQLFDIGIYNKEPLKLKGILLKPYDRKTLRLWYIGSFDWIRTSDPMINSNLVHPKIICV